jgi:hypothetical protein
MKLDMKFGPGGIAIPLPYIAALCRRVGCRSVPYKSIRNAVQQLAPLFPLRR